MAYTPFDLSGKSVLVTGGNGGIGLGMAKALAEAGADVTIWGRNAEKNKAALAALEKTGARAWARAVDVAEESAVEDGIGDIVKVAGRLDAVFANAGISGSGQRFIDTKAEDYERIFAINLNGVFFTLREAARAMVERAEAGEKGGSLVGIASIAAIEGAARAQAYAASKGGVVSMMRGCAVEFARFGIRANAVLPGWIDTEMTEGLKATPAFIENVISRVPARRWGAGADFGGIAVYLASDASAFHSGDAIRVDGGYSIF